MGQKGMGAKNCRVIGGVKVECQMGNVPHVCRVLGANKAMANGDCAPFDIFISPKTYVSHHCVSIDTQSFYIYGEHSPSSIPLRPLQARDNDSSVTLHPMSADSALSHQPFPHRPLIQI